MGEFEGETAGPSTYVLFAGKWGCFLFAGATTGGP